MQFIIIPMPCNQDAEATLTTAIRTERAVTAHRIGVLTDQHKRQHKKSTDKNIIILQQVESVSNVLNATLEGAKEVRKQMETTIKMIKHLYMLFCVNRNRHSRRATMNPLQYTLPRRAK